MNDQWKWVNQFQPQTLYLATILCYVDAGATLARGQRYGFIRFGSRVDVYLDPGARPRVAVGDVVAATETVLAELP